MNRLLGIIGVILGIAGCTMSDSSSITAEKQPDFNIYRSFAWLPKDSTQIQNVLFDNQIIEKTIRESVNNELFTRGYQVNRDTPDVLLQYTIVVEQREEKLVSTTTQVTNPVPYNYYPMNYGNSIAYDNPANLYAYNYTGSYNNQNFFVNQYPYYNSYGFPAQYPQYQNQDVYQTQYKEGTLIIDMIERRTGKLLWRGWNKDVLYDPASYEKIIPGEVSEIFNEYPKH